MLGLMIFPYHQSPIIRLNPGAPEAKPPRRQGTPVPPAQVEAVRRLVEESPLSFRAIARETGVSLASRLAPRDPARLGATPRPGARPEPHVRATPGRAPRPPLRAHHRPHRGSRGLPRTHPHHRHDGRNPKSQAAGAPSAQRGGGGAAREGAEEEERAVRGR